MDYQNFLIAMRNSGCKKHHTAMRPGYVSRKNDGHAERYNGRFGRGWIWVSPRRDTTRYVDVTYFLVDGGGTV